MGQVVLSLSINTLPYNVGSCSKLEHMPRMSLGFRKDYEQEHVVRKKVYDLGS